MYVHFRVRGQPQVLWMRFLQGSFNVQSYREVSAPNSRIIFLFIFTKHVSDIFILLLIGFNQ